jgi:hypothetical protein
VAVFARINYCKIRFVSVVGLASTNMYPSYFIQDIPPSEIPYTVVTVTSFECLKGLSDSASRGVADSPIRRVRGSLTLRLGESGVVENCLAPLTFSL